MRDAEENPLYAATFDPDEAEELGFFIEEALTPEEAESAMLDSDRISGSFANGMKTLSVRLALNDVL